MGVYHDFRGGRLPKFAWEKMQVIEFKIPGFLAPCPTLEIIVSFLAGATHCAGVEGVAGRGTPSRARSWALV